jgi:glucose/arabinose dehydrogenase
MPTRVPQNVFILWLGLICISACSQNAEEDTRENTSGELSFAADKGSIAVPPGFDVVLVADKLGNARHLCVDNSGDVYVNLGSEKAGKGMVALRDENGDGIADQVKYFGSGAGTAILIHNSYLYYSTNTQVFRYALSGGELEPGTAPELMLTLPGQAQHAAKALAFDGNDNMYVSIGAPSNACQNPSRTKGVPGQDPCPLLDSSGGVWKFSASQPGQTFQNGTRYATGIRHIVGMDWSPSLNNLYAMQHGRDQLHQFWPEHFTEAQSAELPAEEMLEIQQGDNFGWPYCFYDQIQARKVLAPEYGGDGSLIGRCNQYEKPVMAFPGHWAPNSLKFSRTSSFPAKYHNGAFVAFHGSWNRAPFPQQGYKVVFVPFSNGQPSGNYEDFATEFEGDGSPVSYSGEAEYRPCGLAFGPDGSLYVCDSSEGRVWRIVYTGN